MQAAPGSGARGAEAEVFLWWQQHYVRRPGEQLYVASPFRIPFGSPFLPDAISKLKAGLEDSKKQEYNFFMKIVVPWLRTLAENNCLFACC
jgi:hypothetical protein